MLLIAREVAHVLRSEVLNHWAQVDSWRSNPFGRWNGQDANGNRFPSTAERSAQTLPNDSPTSWDSPFNRRPLLCTLDGHADTDSYVKNYPRQGRDNTLQERSTVQCPRLMRCRDLRWTRALADPTDPPQLKFLLRALEQTAYAWITYQLGRMAPPAPAHCGVWHDVHARSVEASD